MLRAGRQFLCARIGQLSRSLHHFQSDLYFQCRQLEFSLPQPAFTALKCLRTNSFEKETISSRNRLKHKFEGLQSKLHQSSTTSGPARHNWVVNLSPRALSPAESSVLAKGLNFAPSPLRVPIPQMVAAVASGLSKCDGLVADETRVRVVSILHCHRFTVPPSNFDPGEARAMKALQDATIVILPADKGRASVVMDRSDYGGKIHSMLVDENTYNSLVRNPTPALEHRLNRLLLSLKRDGLLSPQLYHHLHSSSGKVPLLYGLPKLHKPGVPLRPIVSFIDSHTYNLCKHLVSLQSPLTGDSPSHVRFR